MMDSTTRDVEDLVLSQGLTPKQLEELALSLTRRQRKHHGGSRPQIAGTISMNGETSEFSIDATNGGWQQWMVTETEGFARVEYLDAMVGGLLADTEAFEPEEEDEEND